ncbi:site-specific DNA-methyltransferase [Tessaracoccus sp. OS52]|uniref:TRM11 family SAM-dependent methyltransferase n=1 Tax=Tessaracoccus sp. OS52 TaxID=2886691 RepID=UPI001D1280BB|nr:site-specific DNA-methyltransferase [Tessaracoccus sp. OS52]MCC2594417.1 site-specific DNA-methyltransferase [Tessaracoccus sp. OS52]
MPDYLLLRSPSANRVYAGEAATLSVAELEITAPFVSGAADAEIAGVGYLGFAADELGEAALATVASQSTAFALFERSGDLLRPVALPKVDVLDDDLVTIPKYQGKTNEQFTRLLLNVTLAAVTREPTGPRQILDPMAGRGTTLSTALLAGHEGYGVEADVKAFEQMAAFYTTWLRRKRIKHKAGTTPVRRDGKAIGKRFDATVGTAAGELGVVAFTGDTRNSADLFGKKKFDAVVVDAPYGVVHGSSTDVHGTAGKRDRTPAGLLRQAIPVWAGQLMHGGALGLSWNTLGMPREDLAEVLGHAGLVVREGGAWERFAHRVDSSIRRDLIVATKP